MIASELLAFKMYESREDYDSVVWDLNDNASEESVTQLRRPSICDKVVSLVARNFGRTATLVRPLRRGGYNILYRVHVDGLEHDVLMRLPCPNLTQFPAEKTMQEAATALLLHSKTQLPAAKIIHYELDSEVGPFLMLQYVENNGDMVDALAIPGIDPDTPPVLYEQIEESKLGSLYARIAKCLLQLWQPDFCRIGSLAVMDDGYVVSGRPITQNMSNMMQLANIPRDIFPAIGTTYGSADEWYTVLAEMHLAQLVFQHNDLVTSEEDCRNKYVARQLFRKLAKEKKLSRFGFVEDEWSAQSQNVQIRCPAPDGTGSFRLWCDDLKPTSFLINEESDITAAIDWEFTYAAPSQFMLDPPWWLLLEVPEMWPDGIEDWAKVFEKRMETWLHSMEEAEDQAEQKILPFNIFDYMRESWLTGRFWVNYAARKSWAFDMVFWKFLDERFFGIREDNVPLWEARFGLLSQEERQGMETFVERKMEESKKRILINWKAGEARQRMRDILV